MLKDLLKDLDSVKTQPAHQLIENMVSDWMNNNGTESQRSEIIDFAKAHNLSFLLPSDWFDDLINHPLKKAEDSNKDISPKEAETPEDVDNKHLLFTADLDLPSAETFKGITDFLKKVSKGKHYNIIFLEDGKQVGDGVSFDGDTFKYEGDESYSKKSKTGDTIEKAHCLVELYKDSDIDNVRQTIENIVSAINNNDHLVIDPSETGKIFDTSKLNNLKASFEGNNVSITGNNIKDAWSVIKYIADLANPGHSFEITDGDKNLCGVDGDGSDRFKSVRLVKATDEIQQMFSNADIFGSSFSPVKYRLIDLQEELAPYGVIINYQSQSVVSIYADNGVEQIVYDKLNDLDLDEYIREAYLNNKGIWLIILDLHDLAAVQPEHHLVKAKKGTPGYDKWLENYRAKRKKKQDDSKSKGDDDTKELQSAIEHLRDFYKKHKEDDDFQIQRAQNEEFLKQMFNGRPRDSKGRYIKIPKF